MKNLFVLLALIPAPAAFSHAVSVPPGTLLAFQGVDATSSAPCYLFVTGVQQSGASYGALRVQTGYGHGHDKPAELTVFPQRPDVWAGASANGQDQIAITFKVPNDPRSASQYNFKWWHVNHAHHYQCLRMQAVKL